MESVVFEGRHPNYSSLRPEAAVRQEAQRLSGAKGRMKVAPGQINTYDIWKTIAVVTMMIDHFGLFGFSRNIYLRLVGRFSAPAFFFLVGVASSKRVSYKHLGWAALLYAINWIYGLVIPHNNVMFAILIAKPFLSFVPIVDMPWPFLVPLQVCLIVSNHIVQPYLEYGNLCLLHAIGGELHRTRHSWRLVWIPTTCAFHFYRSLVFYRYRHREIDMVVGVISFVSICVACLTFRQRAYGPFRDRMLEGVTNTVSWISRHSLEIYVLHLIAYKFHQIHAKSWLQQERSYH